MEWIIPKKENEPSSQASALRASVSGLSDYYAKEAIVAGVSQIKGGITSQEFCNIFSSVKFDSDVYALNTIKGCAKYIKTPFKQSQISTLLKDFSGDSYVSDASKAIMSINSSLNK